MRDGTTGEFLNSLRIRPRDLSVSQCSRRGSTAGPGGCGPSAPAADSCAGRATRCRGFHAPSLLHWFPLQPAEPLLGWINTGCSSTVLPRALYSSAVFTACRLVPRLPHTNTSGFTFEFTLRHHFVTFFLCWLLADTFFQEG